MLFTADHNGFYREGCLFFPLISFQQIEEANTVLIRLPARLQDDLDWSQEIKMARQCIDSAKNILWEIDLGLSHYQFDPQDSAAFFSFTLALEEFSAKIWPEFHNQTFGVALYRGAFNPSLSFPMAKWELPFSDWREEMRDDYPLFCAQNFAEYLHRLVSFLPDAVLTFLLIDVSEISSPAKEAQLFSKERFEHTHLILKGASAPFSGITWERGQMAQGWLGSISLSKTEVLLPTVGLYLPKDSMIDSSILAQLDRLIALLQDAQTPFRIVSEEKLTEQWDGLDQLWVLTKTVSSQGKRKLLGFIAAGGIVTTWGEPLGLLEETNRSISF